MRSRSPKRFGTQLDDLGDPVPALPLDRLSHFGRLLRDRARGAMVISVFEFTASHSRDRLSTSFAPSDVEVSLINSEGARDLIHSVS
ncbi:hypothetical protein [Streptomyces sp. YIM 121038]|uniref:hypothetical protein n=1 Tax=Streptomyces sp. YIM 121038 TaxID=2136401 RepID=UPI001485FBF2|nr:hypothetical protein [Streptomyces sp. YIM 121038]